MSFDIAITVSRTYGIEQLNCTRNAKKRKINCQKLMMKNKMKKRMTKNNSQPAFQSKFSIQSHDKLNHRVAKSRCLSWQIFS